MSSLFQFAHRKLGEPHNFGKATCLRSDGKVVKPRNTAWERAFLSAHSPLRQRLEAICRAGGMDLPFPDLQYSALPEGGSAVDYLSLDPVSELTERDVESLGVSIAVAVWFGMTALDAENFVCGTATDSTRGRLFRAVPLDIESVLRPVADLCSTGLVTKMDGLPPSAALSSNAGLLPLRHLMAKQARSSMPAVLIGSFSAMFALLQRNRHDFTPLIAALLEEPVRVLLRETDFYRGILARGPGAVKGTVGLLDEEVRQLIRGDIPWFFTLPGSDQIFWFDSPESYKPLRLAPNGSFSSLRQLPRWPLLSSQEDYASLQQNCVQSLVHFFWRTHPVDATHAGIHILNDSTGIQIKSTGQYQPVSKS